MSWLTALSSNYMPPTEVNDTSSKLFDDFIDEMVKNGVEWQENGAVSNHLLRDIVEMLLVRDHFSMFE